MKQNKQNVRSNLDVLKMGLGWNNCDSCKLFRQLNLWRLNYMLCMDCIKRQFRKRPRTSNAYVTERRQVIES